MQPQEQAKIIVQRFLYLIDNEDKQYQNFSINIIKAKNCGIFLAEQAQKTADIRGFNFWADVIEAIQEI